MNTSMNYIIALDWTVRADRRDYGPVTATVPGACQKDLADYLQYPDYRFGTNSRKFMWMEDVPFIYKAVFDKPETDNGQQVWFVAKAIDYQCSIRLNSQIIKENEGSQTPIEVCLEGLMKNKDNMLEIHIFPSPKKVGVPEGREQASHVTKAPVSYGWDWHPRMIPSGIWDDAGLQIRSRAWIDNAHVNYHLNDSFSSADIDINVLVGGDKTDTKLKWYLYDSNEKTVCSESTNSEKIHSILTNPNLWWTHDHGIPYLYESVIYLTDEKDNVLDKFIQRVGFRSLRLVMNSGAWDRSGGFPVSRADAPIQVELNGRKLFAKGTNWVNPDIFPGTISIRQYETLLNYAKRANFNILRCWGGCMANKDSFYKICDELGLLVWQEFPLACNNYKDDWHYLKILEKEATSIVERLMDHPSILLFCGGNELFNSWSGMDDQSLAIRLLNSICFRKCPHIPFLSTSPLNGMGHGHYLFRDEEGNEVFSWMKKATNTAYCEFGVGALSPVDTLKMIIPEDELFPIRMTESWILHHAFKAWDDKPYTWLDQNSMNHYFRKPSTLAEAVELSGILQGEGLRCVYEEARRQKPFCSMALNWMFNEPWPTAANNSIIAYPSEIKPGYNKVSAACRPVCASASFDKYQWNGGECLKFTLWILNDSFTDVTYPKSAIVVLRTPDGSSMDFYNWRIPKMSANENIKGPEVSIMLPDWPGADRFQIELLVAGHPEMDSCYTLSYVSPSEKAQE